VSSNLEESEIPLLMRKGGKERLQKRRSNGFEEKGKKRVSRRGRWLQGGGKGKAEVIFSTWGLLTPCSEKEKTKSLEIKKKRVATLEREREEKRKGRSGGERGNLFSEKGGSRDKRGGKQGAITKK